MVAYHRSWLLALTLAAGCAAVSALPSGAIAADTGANVGTVVPETADTARGSRRAPRGGFACINHEGEDPRLAYGKNAVSVTEGDTGPGSYVVKFRGGLSRCAYTATIGLCGALGTEEPGLITTVRRFNDPRAVYVTTHDPDGTFAPRSFFLTVTC